MRMPWFTSLEFVVHSAEIQIMDEVSRLIEYRVSQPSAFGDLSSPPIFILHHGLSKNVAFGGDHSNAS